jgi:protein phosphatase
MKTIGVTHIGNVRATNEDTLLIQCEKKPCYMLVADGMGGHAAGEVASRTAADSIKEFIEKLHVQSLTEDQIKEAIIFANSRLLEEIEKDGALKGMGTTLTFVYAERDSFIVAQVGDSSAYLYDGAETKKITKDHTYIQHLIDSGVIEKKAAADYPFKNIITRALGMKKLEIDIYNTKWKEGDLLLLCSDGLTAYTDIDKLAQVLSEKSKIDEKAQDFVDYALESGGKDNITVIIAKNEQGEDVL